jgi:hypothetical protein
VRLVAAEEVVVAVVVEVEGALEVEVDEGMVVVVVPRRYSRRSRLSAGRKTACKRQLVTAVVAAEGSSHTGAGTSVVAVTLTTTTAAQGESQQIRLTFATHRCPTLGPTLEHAQLYGRTAARSASRLRLRPNTSLRAPTASLPLKSHRARRRPLIEKIEAAAFVSAVRGTLVCVTVARVPSPGVLTASIDGVLLAA